MSEQAAGGAGLQALKFIWLAFLSALVIYALLPLLLRLPEQSVDPQLQAILFIALSIAAVSTIGVIVMIRRAMPAAPVNPDSTDARRRTMLVSLVSWALAEAVALFGVVLYVLFRQPLHLYPFLVVAFGLLLLLAPRANRMGRPSSDLARPDVKIG